MGYDPQTIEECKTLYLDAEEISMVVQQAAKDGLQGKSLLKAKKLICGDEWNKEIKTMSNSLGEKWKSFLHELNLIDKNGIIVRNVRFLLDFAGYKEAESNLIQQGIPVEEITTASHYREVKKLTDELTSKWKYFLTQINCSHQPNAISEKWLSFLQNINCKLDNTFTEMEGFFGRN